MPRFPVNFRRRSTVTDDQNGPVEPSFRVLERREPVVGKSFDGGARMVKAQGGIPRSTLSDIAYEDNLFVDAKSNRGSGSSNATKIASDSSSRYSNASTAPSSTDHVSHEDLRNLGKKSIQITPGPSPPPSRPKSSGNGFLKQAGRTFSFGGSKKNNTPPPIPTDEPVPALPDDIELQTPGSRSRAATASTITTATPPQVEDRDFMLDLGGDLSNMLSAFNKRASVLTLKNDAGHASAPSTYLTGNRAGQPPALRLDHTSSVEPPPKSWNSQRSDEGLLGSGRMVASPPPVGDDVPPPVPRHAVSPALRRERSVEEDEDAGLLKDSLAATRFLSASNNGGYRREPEARREAPPSRLDPRPTEDNMFETSFSLARYATGTAHRGDHQRGQNKVMTPAEFERYRQDKVRRSQSSPDRDASESEEEDNYEEEEDDLERTKKLAKQRQKQEAQMMVYRQTMMKVTGEQSGGLNASRPSLSMSLSTPNLSLEKRNSSNSPSDGSDDEEVPLAILAAHGFPNKNRPPTRLSNMASNPNLRASLAQPSYTAGPGSVAGDPVQASGGRLPAFARKLPQDPFVGASLVNQPPRESFALAGGAPAAPPSLQSRSVPVGGLVGVIANEERQRALRRGSPAIDNVRNNSMSPQMQMSPMAGAYDPMAQLSPQMMYPMGMQQMGMANPGGDAQMQMTQQMQQFMQMQMQFMQMMASRQQPNVHLQTPNQGGGRPMSHMPNQSMTPPLDAYQGSFLGGDPMAMGMSGGMGLQPPRGDAQMRTMSMVQPSSASWIQAPQSGYAPSVRQQGAGYAPSIAPSERSNIGLPGRYRPVSSINPLDAGSRAQSMSGTLPTLSKMQPDVRGSPVPANADDEDDEKGWEAMKAKREKKKSSWRMKKNYGSDIGALIS